MARNRIGIPAERRIIALKARKIDLRVKVAEAKEQMKRIDAELSASRPKKKRDPLLG